MISDIFWEIFRIPKPNCHSFLIEVKVYNVWVLLIFKAYIPASIVLGSGILVTICSEGKFFEKFTTFDCPLRLRGITDVIVEQFFFKVNSIMFYHEQTMSAQIH